MLYIKPDENINHPNIALVARVASLEAKAMRLVMLAEEAFSFGRYCNEKWLNSDCYTMLMRELDHE